MENITEPVKLTVLVDASFLNFITSDFKANFERMLNRQLEVVDLSVLFSYIIMDCGIMAGNNEIDVYLIYNQQEPELAVCSPSNVKNLHEMAFKNELGEFSFYAFSNEGFASIDEFFLDSLVNLLDDDKVNRLAVVGFNEHYGENIDKILADNKGTVITKFAMNSGNADNNFSTEIIAYPIMMALGISSNELK